VSNVGKQNLQHALDDMCTDNDCEIHNPEVGFEEEVVTETDLAFFYAGAMWMWHNYNAVSPVVAVNQLKAKLGVAGFSEKV